MKEINLTPSYFKSLKDHIYYNLGGGLVNVELEEEHYIHAFINAKNTYLQKGNLTHKHRFITMPLEGSKREYVIEDYSINAPIQIIDLRSSIFGDASDPFHQAIITDLFYEMRSSHLNSTQNLLTYELSLHIIDNINRLMANDIAFDFDKFENKLILQQTPQTDKVVLLECYLNPSDDELAQLNWVRDFAAAKAQEVLGRAYNKFKSIKGPGGEIQLPSDLVKDAKEWQNNLLEELQTWDDQGSSGSPVGGFILKG